MSEYYRPIIKEGTHLASSKETEGAYRGSLLDNDTRQLAGQAEWELVEEDEGSDLLKMAMVVACSVVGYIVVEKTAPIVKNWWVDKAFPSIKKKWNSIISKEEFIQTPVTDETCQEDPNGVAIARETAPAVFSKRIDEAYEEYSEHVDSKEAQEHLIAILAAAAFIAEEIRKLSDTCIRNDSDYHELQNAMEKLTTQKVTSSINLMLENNISLLDEKTSKIFLEIFGGGQFVNGIYVPIENEKVKGALSLDFLAA